MWTDAERREVYAALEPSVGTRVATLLTQAFPPFDWDTIARRGDLVGLATRDEVAALRSELKAEIAELRAELRGELHYEIGSVRGELGELRGELGELRGELGELRGELRGLPGRVLLANVPLAIGVAGLVLAAAKLV